MSIVCCEVEVSAMNRSLVQRSPAVLNEEVLTHRELLRQKKKNKKVSVCYADIVPVFVVQRFWSAVCRSLEADLEVVHPHGFDVQIC